MKLSPSHWATMAVLVLIGLTAAVLSRMQSSQRLGQPGLMMTAGLVLDEEGGVVNTNTVALPPRVLDYRSEAKPVTKTELSWLPSDTTYARRYYEQTNGFGLMLNVVLMGQDRTSIHRPQICLTGQGWTIERSDLLNIAVPNGSADQSLPVMRLIASRPFQEANGTIRNLKAVYVYWFVADGQVTARHGQRMWWMAVDLLTRGILQRWAYVSCLAVGLPGSEEELYHRIEEFVAAAVPQFQQGFLAPQQHP